MKRIPPLVLAGLLFSLFTAHVQAVQEEELLEPERAFAIDAQAPAADHVIIEWTVAEGYYVYRDRFKFKSDTPGVRLGTAQIPPGKIKKDQFFGEVEIHRGKVAVTLPIERDAGAGDAIQISATSQGCADLGVCYPPLSQTVLLNLPPASTAATTAQTSPLDKLSRLGDNLGLGQEEEFLPPDEAFAFSAIVVDGNTLAANWNIAEHYYLYKNKVKFKLVDANGATLGEPQFPVADIKQDQFFGRMEVYHKFLDVKLPLARGDSQATGLVLEATFQGCADAGICYPPMTRQANLELPATTPGASADTTGAAADKPSDKTQATRTDDRPAAPVTEQDELAAMLTNRPVVAVLFFFLLGLGLAFTPCVFPMIPILSSIIVGQGETLTMRRAFTLSLVYVLAMAVTYTAAGVIAATMGENLQAAFQDPWVISTFVGIFILLSLSMFGFYELQVPNFLQSKLTEISNRQEGGTLLGVGVMGFLSALIVGPCVAAPLMGALLVIGQTGDAVLGGAALFSMSLGMGVPLLVIGTSAGKILPRAGDWMNAIKAVFGVLLLGVGIWMLERIIPANITLLLWAVLLMVSAIYLGALEGLGPNATGWTKFWKGGGLVVLLYGSMLLIGAAGGGSTMWPPLTHMQGVSYAGMAPTALAGGPAPGAHLEFKKVANLRELDAAIAKANAAGKVVMLDYYADWCTDCVRMEKKTFSHPQVQQALSKVVLLQADVTDNNEADKELLRRFKIIGPPAILFFDESGNELRGFRIVGFYDPEQFLAHLKLIIPS